jgi:hypothetical protein
MGKRGVRACRQLLVLCHHQRDNAVVAIRLLISILLTSDSTFDIDDFPHPTSNSPTIQHQNCAQSSKPHLSRAMQALQQAIAAAAGPLNLWTAALRENPASQLVPVSSLRTVYPPEIKLRPLTMAMGGMVSLPVWRPQAARQFVEGRSIKDLQFSSDKDFNHLSPPCTFYYHSI